MRGDYIPLITQTLQEVDPANHVFLLEDLYEAVIKHPNYDGALVRVSKDTPMETVFFHLLIKLDKLMKKMEIGSVGNVHRQRTGTYYYSYDVSYEWYEFYLEKINGNRPHLRIITNYAISYNVTSTGLYLKPIMALSRREPKLSDLLLMLVAKLRYNFGIDLPHEGPDVNYILKNSHGKYPVGYMEMIKKIKSYRNISLEKVLKEFSDFSSPYSTPNKIALKCYEYVGFLIRMKKRGFYYDRHVKPIEYDPEDVSWRRYFCFKWSFYTATPGVKPPGTKGVNVNSISEYYRNVEISEPIAQYICKDNKVKRPKSMYLSDFVITSIWFNRFMDSNNVKKFILESKDGNANI